jgi:hypothetical protein
MDLLKITNIQFQKNLFSDKPADTSGLAYRCDEASSLFLPIYEHTQNELHAPSHTFTHIPLSDVTANQTYRHVLPSVCWHSARSELPTIG